MIVDPVLLALTLKLQAKARTMTQSDHVEMSFAAADMLDYLGERIDEEKRTERQYPTQKDD